jgi:peptidoglycan/xylan/chitin deacetylase (PgdA/CDA1 family)
MFKNVKERATRIFGPIGVYGVSSFFTRNRPRILMYHRFSEKEEREKISKDVFYSQMQKLTKRFNVISLNSLFNSGVIDVSPPKNAIVITVDDGYRDFYDIAYPILVDFKLPAVVYITTNFIDGKTWLWPDTIEFILKKSDKSNLSLEYNNTVFDFPLSNEIEIAKAWVSLNNFSVTLDNDCRIEFISQLKSAAEVDLPPTPVDNYTPLTWDQIREMSDNGITIGAHTCNHPILSKLDKKIMEVEIGESKSRIETMIGKPVTCFCYPNGQASDYNDEVINIVKKCGFLNAVTAFYDVNDIKSKYELRRHTISDNMYQYDKAIYGIKYLSEKLIL